MVELCPIVLRPNLSAGVLIPVVALNKEVMGGLALYLNRPTPPFEVIVSNLDVRRIHNLDTMGPAGSELEVFDGHMF